MPLYEYRCSSGHHFEKSEGFNAPTEQKCLTCGGPARRQISLPAVIFKGAGFYSTDNRKSGSGNGSAASESKVLEDGHGHSHGSEPKATGDGHGHAPGSELKAEAKTD